MCVQMAQGRKQCVSKWLKWLHVHLDNGVTRVAKMCRSQGAVALLLDFGQLQFNPSIVVPDPALPFAY